MRWPFRSCRHKRNGLLKASNRLVMRAVVHDAIVGGPHVPKEKPEDTAHMERWEKFTSSGGKQ